MKRLLFVLAICFVFVSCESKFGDFDKVRFQGKDISGYWLWVKDENVNGEVEDEYDGGGEPMLYCFDGDTATWLGGFGGEYYRDGYIYGFSFDRCYSEVYTLEIRGNKFFLGGTLWGIVTLEKNDIMRVECIDDWDHKKYYEIYKRIYGLR